MRRPISSRRRTLLPLICALLASLGGAAWASDWQLVPSPTDDALHAAFFLDDARGWVIAHESGKVLHTADGGKTWTLQAEIDRGPMEWVLFADPERGWICGERGRIDRTVDGGATWTRSGPPGPRFACGSLHFRDPRTGIALGVDQGPRGNASRPEDLKPAIYDTTDGGETWTAREHEIPGVGFTGALAVLDDRTLVAGGFGVVYRSDDGGETWETIPLGTGDNRAAVHGLSFAGESVGWAVGSGGLIARTADRGHSWQIPPPITRYHLRGVLFTDERNGFIIGERSPERGLIYRTEDGGETWRRIEGDHPPLHRILAAGARIIAVGAKGTILRRPKPVPPPPPPEPVPPPPPEPTSEDPSAAPDAS